MKNLIDVVIPTYNREDYLYSCLHSLSKHCISNGSQVSFLVVDNGTVSQSIQALVTEMSGDYIRNHTNFGANMSVVRCFAAANSTYVHVIGDDDLVLPGYPSMSKRIINESPDYVFLADKFWHKLLPSICTMHQILLEIARNPLLLGSFSHITSLIHKKECFDFESALREVDTFYPFLWSILSNILTGLSDPRTISVSVVDGSNIIKPSGIQLNAKNVLRPSAVDKTDAFTGEDLERGFQSTLFTIWAKIFMYICGNQADVSRLKSVYCRAVDKVYKGSYNHLMSVVEYERGMLSGSF